MQLSEYQNLAMRTRKPLPKDQQLAMACMGLAGESGEFVDYMKKCVFHNADYSPVRAAKELGDVLWYVAAAASALGLSLDDVGMGNIEKLRERYPDSYNDFLANNRKPGDE